MAPENVYLDWIDLLHRFQETIPGIITRIAFSLLTFLVAMMIRSATLRILTKRDANPRKRIQLRSVSLYLSLFSAGLFILPLWLSSIQSFLTVLGIFGAGVLIVFKELLLNVMGWIYIMTRRPFAPGDRIQIDSITGDVLDIRIQDFSMLEVHENHRGGHSTGRVVYQPNSRLFVAPVINGSKDFAFNWHELDVHLTPDSNWQRASTILEEVGKNVPDKISKEDSRIRKSQEQYEIRYRHLEPRIYVDATDESIVITLRFLCEPRLVREMRSAIWTEILELFSFIEDINIGKKC